MRAFDSLAPDARELLNYASENYYALQIARAKAGGRSSGAVFVFHPNERQALLEAIAKREAAIPPLKIVDRTKVVRATLRPLARGRMFSRRSA
ncbi:MAG: hypothetical protein WBO09_17585 [Methylocystis silviterrae]|uniref:hypothetical protein n=1 Tax=Methylocystis silviterrae TaxID=2743612 RepID=UPI003C732D95